MVVSAVGMALVSLVSMRETSYEDALDQQRRQNNRSQPQRSDRRKKDKTVDKRRTRRREVPEPDALEPAVASTSEPESDPEPATEPAASPPAAEPLIPAFTSSHLESWRQFRWQKRLLRKPLLLPLRL